ncbi:hypothetical protein GQ43DRAFT_171210 [Delitschia confertaspora ATCC 74209]|uniref:Uncharacterized protein n=1 Tax=Delitschia confertaspora ATCC 74209 TaxID=1513339 RepID=A0A9P4JHP3_9PLEO|nr:hypothetical protein GQ43DRAFT_171210 [Delitschia confertaspora ATCC 74209]
MPPIPIHKNDPIAPTAAKAPGPSAIESQDTLNPLPTRTLPVSVPATTTQSANLHSGPPPPQPGAFPVPHPTGPASSYSTHSPAAPQPGASPYAGPTATHITTETRYAGPPPQFSIPPPTDSALQGRSTFTKESTKQYNPAPPPPGPTTLDFGPANPPPPQASPYETGGQPRRASLGHPPNYTQNPSTPYHTPGTDPLPYTQEESASGSGHGGVGEAAWNLLSRAGEALKKGEEAAWNAVRKN